MAEICSFKINLVWYFVLSRNCRKIWISLSHTHSPLPHNRVGNCEESKLELLLYCSAAPVVLLWYGRQAFFGKTRG